MDFERLTKTVRVTDPECWYGRDTVEVHLFVTPPYKDNVLIRIFIETIDDFAVTYDYECEAKYQDNIRSMYNHIKTWV